MTSKIKEPSPFQLAILRGINVLNKHIYAGSVSQKEADRRHAKNKRARVARRNNRGK